MSFSSLEALAFFMEIMRKEELKFNVSINTSDASHLTAATASELSFDTPHNRCNFLYRCGTINLCFAKGCFSKFLSSYANAGQLMYKWLNSPNFTACSISKGPALDYIALLLAISEKALLSPGLVKNIKVVTKYGAWRNTANLMLEVLREGRFVEGLLGSLPFGTIEVLQGDPFKELTEKIRDPISNSDVVLMMKTLNLLPDTYDQKAVLKSIQLFIDALKPGAVLFCIDTKISITEITQVLSAFPGNYLFEPTLMNTMISFEFDEAMKSALGCLPVVSGRGHFFVWQKSSIPAYDMETFLAKVKQSVDLLCERSFGSDNSESLASKHDAVGATASINYFPSIYNDQQCADNFNNCSGGSSLSSHSSENKLPTHKRDYHKSDSIEISIDQCVQTENENSEETESVTIAELTNRISLLTTELSGMLEANTSSGHFNDHGCQNSGACNSVNDCNHSHLNKCSRLQSCAHNCDKFYDNCNPHVCDHGRLTPRQCGSNISLNESVGKCCCASQQLRLPTGDNSHSSPQLVIPINNLSADVLTQIVSLLNQSKQDKT